MAQAVGSFVAWPGRLLTLGHPSKSTRKKKSLLGHHSLSLLQKQPSELVQAVSSRLQICLEEYVVGARLEHGEDFMLPLEFEPKVNGRPSSEYVTNDVLKEISMHGMARTNAFPSGLHDKFKIISPHTFASHRPNTKKKDLSRDLVDIFISRAAGPQTLFLAPYCQGYGTLDADCGRSHEAEDLGFVAIPHKSSLTLPPVQNGQFDDTFPWKKVKCLRQPKKSFDCGYWVMKFMKEIIMHNADTIPTQYFPNTYCTVYSSVQMEDIIEELAMALYHQWVQNR
ncbi:uncharacterized protein LOC114749920 [Neltuma alba]|uniref:uncharacterized protein LOC114749920 n=1 Tax=Neltuma alba TaxID=207710 RepID=UPI0010A2B696|nr:uncharacterized protein LOC114749920 [Prosopis alba]